MEIFYTTEGGTYNMKIKIPEEVNIKIELDVESSKNHKNCEYYGSDNSAKEREARRKVFSGEDFKLE